MSTEFRIAGPGVAFHSLPWADFDDLACGKAGADVVVRLRHAERSRRLLLLRALVDETTKTPELFGPLPSSGEAWELLTRVQEKDPDAFNLVLAHPYTGSWAGYMIRQLAERDTRACPIWVHIGYMHALAAAAAIRAGLAFHTRIPVWNGGAVLPTMGFAQLASDSQWSVAEVCSERARVQVSNESETVFLPPAFTADAPGWCSIPQLTMRTGEHVFSARLDDIDPYRGLYEPVPPQRLDDVEVGTWRVLLNEAWQLIVHYLPDISRALATGLDSLVPRPAVPFRMPSASTGEAFGSAIISRPPDAASLAATLVHEFQHIRLGGLLHLIRLHEDDPRERFYTPWRDDPRPIGGVLQGVYAFFGVTAFWRALANDKAEVPTRRAEFEFAHWRVQTWHVLCTLRNDPSLTKAGQRFIDGIAERLGPWQEERIPDELVGLISSIASDHHAGWRIRHVLPNREAVAEFVDAWLAARRPRMITIGTDWEPTSRPDGTWSAARTDLIRLSMADVDGASAANNGRTIVMTCSSVPDATAADVAYVTGKFTDAARGYGAELAADPDRPAAWVGLGLALSELGAGTAARALLHYPEVVRAVHRRLRTCAESSPAPDDLAAWLGRFVQ